MLRNHPTATQVRPSTDKHPSSITPLGDNSEFMLHAPPPETPPTSRPQKLQLPTPVNWTLPFPIGSLSCFNSSLPYWCFLGQPVK